MNLAFIIQAAESLKLSHQAIAKSIETFKGVHHRIEYVTGVKSLPGLKIFNDAKSTNWDATLTAVKAMDDFHLPIHLIIGGKKRGHGDSIMPYLDFLKSKVSHFYLIGEMAAEIEAEIKGAVQYSRLDTLERVFEEMEKKHSEEKGVLLFSPAFPSFDQFKNYAQRGEHFVALASKKLAD